jgi:RNA polymerase sigma-70 factor (ECF subfamily)
MPASVAPSSERDILSPLWADLIATIARRDQAALADFYDQTHRLVFGLLLRVLPERGLAEEVLVEVYQQVWQHAAQFDARRSTPLAWLTTLARRRALERRQISKDQGPPPLASVKTAAQNGIEENSLLIQQRQLARAALDRLSLEQRQAIELAYFNGLSYAEIAARLNLSPGAIRANICEGMRLLRNYLQPLAL